MTTLDDKATEVEERDRELALRRRKPTGPIACGVCYACNEPVKAGDRWCDRDCFRDWEFLEDAKRRNGEC